MVVAVCVSKRVKRIVLVHAELLTGDKDRAGCAQGNIAHAISHCPGSHSGGDELLMKETMKMIREGDLQHARTSAEVSVDSHLMAFAAELSRKTGTVVDMADFKKRVAAGEFRAKS